MKREALDVFTGTLASNDTFARQFLSSPQQTVENFQPPLGQDEKDCLVAAVGAIPKEHTNDPLEDRVVFVANYTVQCLEEKV